MKKHMLVSFAIVSACIVAVPIALYAVQQSSGAGEGSPNTSPAAGRDGEVRDTMAERRRERFVAQFGEDNADLAMAEADRLFGGIMNLLNGPIRIEGVVRSSDGRPLPAVQVSGTSYEASMAWEGENARFAFQTDGEFSTEIESAHGVQLQFSARGFYSELYRVERDFDAEGYQRLISGATVGVGESGALVLQDVEIVLEPYGEITRLRKFAGLLRTRHAEGPLEGLDVGMIGPRQGVTSDISEWPMEAPFVACIIVDAADTTVEDWGTIRAEEHDISIQMPRQVQVMLPEDWGIQRFDFAPPDGSFRRTYHWMREAPEQGYEDALTLSLVDMRSLWVKFPQRDGIYFYFESPLGYGKGKVSSVQSDPETGEIKIGIQFRLQTDGSRNLETLD